MKLNKYLFNTVNNKERGHGQRSVVWLKRSQPCSHHSVFPGGHSLGLAFGSFFYCLSPPHPSLYVSFHCFILLQFDGCLERGAMAGLRGFGHWGWIFGASTAFVLLMECLG